MKAVPREKHLRALKHMYENAPFNVIVKPKMTLSEGYSEILLDCQDVLRNAGGLMSGSFYFKMLDESCSFAANSIVDRFLVVTVSFAVEFMKATLEGTVKSVGKVMSTNGTLVFAESLLYDQNDQVLARGSGVFSRSAKLLASLTDYHAYTK